MSAPTTMPLPDGFGPDHTTTADDKPPKINQDNPPRAAKSTKRGFNLGQNQKPRSGVRSLADEDKQYLRDWYEGIAGACDFVRPTLAAAIRVDGQIDKCVDAWFALAKKNDSVRRWILGIVEGGGWGKLLMAHLPLLIAVLPRRFVEEFLMGRLSAFFGEGSDEDGVPPSFPMGMGFPNFSAPTYPADLQRDPNEQ